MDKTQTVDEVREAGKAMMDALAGADFTLCQTIEDYPIGGKNRGRCELSVNQQPKKGYRTSRRTTDKFGRWCKPKLSVFTEHIMLVITGPCVARDAAWIRTDGGVYLQAANGDNTWLLRAPCWRTPRREATHYFTSTQQLGGTSTSPARHEMPADPPELCDAYDAYLEFYNPLVEQLRQVWIALNTPTFVA